jgi:hypothetical protein
MSTTEKTTMDDSVVEQQQPQTQRFGSRLTENFVKDTSPPLYLCGCMFY